MLRLLLCVAFFFAISKAMSLAANICCGSTVQFDWSRLFFCGLVVEALISAVFLPSSQHAKLSLAKLSVNRWKPIYCRFVVETRPIRVIEGTTVLRAPPEAGLVPLAVHFMWFSSGCSQDFPAQNTRTHSHSLSACLLLGRRLFAGRVKPLTL